jgi:two-component system nitrogen regulation response regulator NtrX
MAHGGTLLLDEVGDMILQAQAKVLRVIQEQKIERLGGEKTIETDVRVIAATNKNLEKACENGTFRQDLYFRLNVIPIHVPALRERPEDIPLLLYHFLKKAGLELELEESALQVLAAYDWPGNVRELKNLAERISVMHRGGSISGTALGGLLGLRAESKSGNPGSGAVLPGGIWDLNFNDARDAFEKRYLEFQLSQNGGIISRTAEAIGIYPSNLHAKLRKYQITVNKEER